MRRAEEGREKEIQTLTFLVQELAKGTPNEEEASNNASRNKSYEMHNKSSDSDSDTIINSTCARKKKKIGERTQKQIVERRRKDEEHGKKRNIFERNLSGNENRNMAYTGGRGNFVTICDVIY